MLIICKPDHGFSNNLYSFSVPGLVEMEVAHIDSLSVFLRFREIMSIIYAIRPRLDGGRCLGREIAVLGISVAQLVRDNGINV